MFLAKQLQCADCRDCNERRYQRESGDFAQNSADTEREEVEPPQVVDPPTDARFTPKRLSLDDGLLVSHSTPRRFS
jgi:hypothetical protein